MKTKRLKIFARIFSIFMICCFAFLGFGCMGRSPDDTTTGGGGNGGGGGGSSSSESLYNMHGTRVLYRPDEYDFEKAASIEEDQPNDYYGKFAWTVLNELLCTYSFADTNRIYDYLPNFSDSNIPLLYDNIRYKVDSIGYVTERKTIDANGNETTITFDLSEQYIIVGTKPAQSWKWTFDYDLSAINGGSLNSILLNSENLYIDGSTTYNTSYAYIDELSLASQNIYLSEDFQSQYKSIYLGTANINDTASYSDYVKTLEYAIYCYALGISPGQVSVSINDNVTSGSGPYYSVEISEFDEKFNPTEALNAKKELFKKHGTYVGLTQNNLEDIEKWVKSNVVGYQSKVSNDNFFRYGKVVEIQTIHSNGDVSKSYSFESLSSGPLGRNYPEAIKSIVEKSAKMVVIGKDGSADVTIDQPYLASEVIEYAGDSFFISGDDNFPASGFDKAGTIKPLEYQSITLMINDPLEISEIWVALKYDADSDGTQAGVWNENKYLDIILDLNYFSRQQQKLYKVASQRVKINDGPYDIMGNDNSIVMFSDFKTNCQDPELKALLNKNALPVGSFNTSKGALTQNPMQLVGSTEARKYYTLEESTKDELTNGYSYRTGRVNEEMYKDTNGCDYFEITYKVIKRENEFYKNYKFYTGIALMLDLIE